MVHDLNNGQVDFPYEWITTRDNSVTLRLMAEKAEWMHSLHGAYSESQFIYGEALKLTIENFDKSQILNVMSMGLGLGYLELITACECLAHSQPFKIISFELDPTLQQLFLTHLELGISLLSSNPDPILIQNYKSRFKIEASEFKEFYLDFFVNNYGTHVVRQALETLSQYKTRVTNQDMVLELRSALTPDELKRNTTRFNLIFYDAFSSKVQSELWSDDFLHSFLSNHTADDVCVLSTYAKVSALNRSLLSNGFILAEKKGYAYKRESTLAYKFR